MTAPVEPRSAAEARGLLRRAGQAALSSLLEGAPYASLVLLASDGRANPLLLLSDLAVHSRNIAADPRVALLVEGTEACADPLEGARVTLLGRASKVEAPALLERFLSRHPAAEGYAGFADFHLYRVTLERAHLVAGFGRIHWVESRELLLPEETPELAAAEPDILAHMNAEHEDALDLIAQRILGLEGAGWRMVGVDAEGFDLRRGAVLARAAFAKNVTDAQTCRVELARLTRKARKS